MGFTTKKTTELKNQIVEVISDQGFSVNGQVIPKFSGKEGLKFAHQKSRKDQLHQHRTFLKKNVSKIQRYALVGQNIRPENIKLKLIEVHPFTIEETLFRWWNLVWWSMPYQRAYGRQMRFIIWDEYHNAPLRRYMDEISYLGHVYGSKPKLPMWFKHFGKGKNGAGEAYHLGIFGKTGSGKSVLAKMILSAYMRYSQMAIVIIDPQGEFSKDFHKGSSDDFRVPLADIADRYEKHKVVISVKNLVLDRWELFKEILYESAFFERLTIPKGENREVACDVLQEKLRKSKVTLKKLHTKEAFDKAWEFLSDSSVQVIFYRSKDSRDRFDSVLKSADKEEFYKNYWKPVAELFRADRNNARPIEEALKWALSTKRDSKLVESRPVLVINLAKENTSGLFWNDKIQSLVIKRVLNGLTNTAEQFFKEGHSLNTLVVMDEAHRLAPRETPNSDTDKAVRNVLMTLPQDNILS